MNQQTWQTITAQFDHIEATAQHLRGSALLASANGTWTIQVVSDYSRQWLAGRLRPQVERVASRVAGHSVTLDFVVDTQPRNSEAGSVEAVAEPELEPAEAEIRQGEASDLARVNHLVAGYSQHSDYVALFWRPYLGPLAFSLWDHIRAHCKDGKREWTPPVDFTASGLAKGIGCSSHAITGVWRGCAWFDRTREEGQPLGECCQNYALIEAVEEWPGQTKPTKAYPQGRATCRHWVFGALEVLAAEGLAVVRQHGTTARSSFFTVQVWQALPILARRQADLLDRSTRIAHRNFLAGLLSRVQKDDPQLKISLTGWQQIDLWSFLPLLEPQHSPDLELSLPKLGVLASGQNPILFKNLGQLKRYESIAQIDGQNQQRYIFFV